MYNFRSDYLEGAHPAILKKLYETNSEQTNGYGEDPYCEEAASIIKEKCESEHADVHFVVGGTQANMLVISSALRPHEAVICVGSGHINVHETGAIEATGHKILAVAGNDGKLTANDVEYVVSLHTDEHMVKPKMVFISNSTEIGTIYSYAELKALRDVCEKHDLYLYMDGARLGSALVSEDNDLTLPDIASLCDVFYIGGTKNGALFGEAIVIVNDDLKSEFRYIMKQKGAMLAKGRLLGIQFKELLGEDLYFDLAMHANTKAMKLKAGLKDLGIEFFSETSTNQLFIILDNDILKRLEEDYQVTYMNAHDDTSSVIRLVTSWNTPDEAVTGFLDKLQSLLG